MSSNSEPQGNTDSIAVSFNTAVQKSNLKRGTVCILNVSGGIGCGKTTVMRKLEERFDSGNKSTLLDKTLRVYFMTEPVHEWKPYLERMYANFCADTLYDLQCQVIRYHECQLRQLLVLRRQAQKWPHLVYVLVVERCPWDVSNVFLKMNESVLSRIQFVALQKRVKKLWKSMVENTERVLSLHLTCSDKEAHWERLQKRARVGGDSHIQQEYLFSLENVYSKQYANGELMQNLEYRSIDTHERSVQQVVDECDKVIRSHACFI